jgi:N6-L-threonylcarbamoyladenine synthase
LARILAIESSCDETAAAVIEDETRVLSSVVASQFSVHGKYGGVVPELASREHLRAIVPVVREALELAGLEPHRREASVVRRVSGGWSDLDAIAATSGPGLAGSLLVGLTYAKAIAFATGLPLIAVNHIEGHIHAVILEARQRGNPVEFPALALIVSGGHTHLFEVSEAGGYKLLGRTRDDAAGEAFDKVAKLLGFGYPGGPVIDRIAPYGDPRAVRFTIARMKGNALDFSFSGLKTAVVRWVESHDIASEIYTRKSLINNALHPSIEELLEATPQATRNLLASFQYTVIEELLRHASSAADRIEGVRSLIVSGGVACNSGLRAAANLHRQCGHDRSRRISEIPAWRFRAADRSRAAESGAGLGLKRNNNRRPCIGRRRKYSEQRLGPDFAIQHRRNPDH